MAVAASPNASSNIWRCPTQTRSASAHHALQQYSKLRLKHAASDGERMAAEFVLKLLKKRLFSSPAAFGITLEKHISTVGGGKAARVQRPETSRISLTTTPTMRNTKPKPARSLAPSARPYRQFPLRKRHCSGNSANTLPRPASDPTAKPRPSSTG